MTRSAFPRRGLVEQHGLTVDFADRLVAEGAGHFLVRPLEGERGARFVVKQRGLPFRRVVAGSAIRHLPLRRELPAVNFLMAVFAVAGRGPEIYRLQRRLRLLRLVTARARHGAMSAQQLKRSRGVIEAGQFSPGFHHVAGLAARQASVGVWLPHPFQELPAMRVNMARSARAVFKPIGYGVSRPAGIVGLMAIHAGHRDVPAGEREAGGLVPRQGKGGGLETLHSVAALALVQVRLPRKLTVVRVAVAVSAARKTDLVSRGPPGGKMAFCAGDFGMPALERILRSGMLADAKLRGLEPLHGMA